MMRYPDEVRRNVTLARSVLFDVLVMIDSAGTPIAGAAGHSVGGRTLATVTIKCPVTGAEIPTDIQTDEDSFATARFEDQQIHCPSCGPYVYRERTRVLRPAT